MKLRYIIFLVLTGFLFYSCEPELDDFDYSSGSANFSTYIALGNSLTAGYADGSLYREGQLASYPSMLAMQFRKIDGGTFEQPLMDGEYGILPGKYILGYSEDCLGTTSLGPVLDQGALDPIAPIGKIVQNLGVPGAKSFHLLAEGYGSLAGVPLGLANPYYARFASSDVSTVLGDAITQLPTFYSLWIGNNDVLGYATTGGVGDTITGQASFTFFMNTILMSIDTTGAKGVIANIPDITSIPFFTTVPANGLVLTEQGQVDELNAAYGPLGITFNKGQNYFIIADANSPVEFRQAVEGELVLLTVPQDSLKCGGWGSEDPIPGEYVLTAQEIDAIENAVAGYNQTIAALATQYDIALVDMNSYMKELQEGLTFDGISLSTAFITGNAFSLDGVHLTPMGYAVIANKFIETINRKYGSNVPFVSVSNYRANVLP
ncbi:MAG: hypothetical protein K8S16_10195 [Bacteroidales bacterium]|nr:hypothetical protein [Bacteroidales bacterium]